MSNAFFDWVAAVASRFAPGTLVRARAANQALDDVTAGFDLAAQYLDASVHAPLGEVLDAMPAAADRASKVLGFDSSGQPAVSVIATSGEMAAAVAAAAAAAASAASAAASLASINALGYKPIGYVAKSANYTVLAADAGKLISCTSTFTLTLSAPGTLGTGWSGWFRNDGTGDVSLAHTSGNVDGLTSYVMYPGECRFVMCDGSTVRTIVLQTFRRRFDAAGTFTTPPGYTRICGLLWAGGGGGGKGDGTGSGGGGGGGACVPFDLPATAFGATETVTIGASSAGAASTGAGTIGNNSTLGSLASAYGGGAGTGIAASNSAAPGTGGGALGAGANGSGTTAGAGGAPADTSGYSAQDGFGGSRLGRSAYGGAAGGIGANTGTGAAGNGALYGGAGGGGSGPTPGGAGTSKFGGAGGSGGDASTSGSDGTRPGGGGGGTMNGTKGGDGAGGRLDIWGA